MTTKVIKKSEKLNMEATEEKDPPRRHKQKELSNMPDRDEVGKAAKKYKDSIDEIDAAKHAKAERKVELIGTMKRHKRLEIQVEGVTFKLQHVEESDDIVVERPKRKGK